MLESDFLCKYTTLLKRIFVRDLQEWQRTKGQNSYQWRIPNGTTWTASVTKRTRDFKWFDLFLYKTSLHFSWFCRRRQRLVRNLVARVGKGNEGWFRWTGILWAILRPDDILLVNLFWVLLSWSTRVPLNRPIRQMRHSAAHSVELEGAPIIPVRFRTFCKMLVSDHPPPHPSPFFIRLILNSR